MEDQEMKDELFGLVHNLPLPQKGIIALYGAGGKTTLLVRLARELAGQGKKVLLTTTTKIFYPAGIPVVIASDSGAAGAALREAFKHNNLVAFGNSLLPANKIAGIEPARVKEFLDPGLASYILLEADGAACKPVKGYASFEPVLPLEADLIVPLQGLDALGLSLVEKNIHRAELFALATGAPLGEPLTPYHFSRSLLQMIIRGRTQSPRARIVPLINKIDLLKERGLLRTLAAGPASSSLVDRLLFTALQEENPVRYVLATAAGIPAPFISCVILAAGSSRRMGQDKLFLPLKGKTVLEHVVQNASAAKVGEVIVVTRPESIGAVEKILAATGVKVVINPWHHRGISSSLKIGLVAANPLAQGIIFALGDQPFVPTAVYNLLLERYAQNLNLFTYPLFKGKRGNPTIFDRRTWPALVNLAGDAGGRQILAKLPAEEVCSVETGCPGILADLDTLADWEKYANGGEFEDF
jgi:molybdenum cofactor cytidylyltransferase